MATSVGHKAPVRPIEIPAHVAERAATRFAADERSGCHISTYSTGSHGYAQIGWGPKGAKHVTVAHRAAWVHVHGQIPEGVTIDHECKSIRCVNVQHLRALSNFENARRTHQRDWELGTCVNGHPNSMLREFPNGDKPPRVKCGECAKSWQRRYEAKRKARAARGAR